MAHTDTLVMFTEVGDALCVDIVEPVGHWRVFFRDSVELGELIRDALNHEGLSTDSAVAVFRDYVDPLIEWQERKRSRRTAARVEEPPAAAKDAARCRPAGFPRWFYLAGGCVAWVVVFVALWRMLR